MTLQSDEARRGSEGSEYWFPAKRYGWGWGPPRTWKGWAVLALFFVLLGVGLFIFLPAGHEVGFFIYTVVLVVLLIAVCYVKGEPPRWRWGSK
jgi:drug/metabolite transporter (DMT)-like permease